jgi:hypothetical protein
MRRQLTSLTDRTERRAHRDGISLLTADECQFFTQSANANTAISKALLLLGSLGVPFIFCSNYSLGHKLKDRPQEERQRLLCSPIVLLPDHHESEDWRDYLAECKRVAGDWLDIDVINDAASIHHYSFGLKRLVVRLIVIAYRHMAESGEKKIKLAQIQRAYLSTDYSVNRVDVETLIRISINSTTSAKEKHLLCPFDLPPTVQAALSEQSRKARDALVTKRYVESSMTAEERSASNIAKKKDIDADNAVPPKPKSPTRRKTVLTQESLRAGFDSFMNEITPGKRKPV